MNILTTILFCILFVSLTQNSQAQKHTIDSLENALTQTEDPNLKAILYYNISRILIYSDPTKSVEYCHQSLKLIPKDQIKSIGLRYNALASAHIQLAEFPTALQYIDSALFIFETIEDQTGIATSYSNKGALFTQKNDYPNASKYYYKSLKIYETQKDSSSIAKMLNNLSIPHLMLGDADLAIDNVKQALKINRMLQNSAEVNNNLYNIGILYSNTEESDSALAYFDQALAAYLKEDNPNYLMSIYSSKALIYEEQGNGDLALQTMEQALSLAKKSKLTKNIMRLNGNRAFLLYNMEKYKESIPIYKENIKLAKEQESLHYQYEALTGLMRNYRDIQQYEDAFEVLQLAFDVKSDIISSEKQHQIEDLEIKYKTDKKIQENILLSQEKDFETLRANRNRQLLYLSIFALFLIIAISFLLVRQYKINAAYLTNQLKHRLLRNQMSPHFIFNSLVAIQNFVYKKAPIQAGEYLASFAELIRAILENSMEEYIPLEKEIQWLDNYLKLQLLRFDNSFEYNINLDESIDTENMLIPPMLTQPFIENALEHGLKDLDYKGKVTVDINISDETLHIHVKDNGIGLNASKNKATNKSHKSLAVKITKERLHFLNKKQQKNIYFNMENLASNGTQVSFSFPVSYKY